MKTQEKQIKSAVKKPMICSVKAKKKGSFDDALKSLGVQVRFK